MMSMRLWFGPEWTINQIEAIKEIVQRMGWEMEDTPDGSDGYYVTFPPEEAPMFFIIQDGVDAMLKSKGVKA